MFFFRGVEWGGEIVDHKKHQEKKRMQKNSPGIPSRLKAEKFYSLVFSFNLTSSYANVEKKNAEKLSG